MIETERALAAGAVALTLFAAGLSVGCGVDGAKRSHQSSTTIASSGSRGLRGIRFGAPARPPVALSRRGRILWQFEALLHETFHKRYVSAHYIRGVAINFACASRVGCAPLAYWAPYFFTFSRAGQSDFHVSKKRFPPGAFGNYPLAIWIKGQFVACDRAEKRFLIAYRDAVGLSLDCL
jgi:hypothetical protein